MPQSREEMQVRIFILLTHSDPLQLVEIHRFIEVGGGRVIHNFPYQAVIAEVPYGIEQQLAANPNVAAVFVQPVNLSAVDVYGREARRYASVWNNLVRPKEPVGDLMAVGHSEGHDDAFNAPDLPPAGGLGPAANPSVSPGYYQTSEYMAGSVAVGIVLVESNGNIDPSIENWTSNEKQKVFNEIVAGLNWWAELEPRAVLSFVYDDHFSNPLPTAVEPITRPYYHQQYWIGDAMTALGYNASSYFSKVRDYNNDLRATYQTDWAFTVFVVDSSVDSDNRFSDGLFAYAYLGGPFMVMTYGNNGYGPGNMDAVAAHEIGHIFQALDQYPSAYQSCANRSGYLQVENQNSQFGSCVSDMTSIMRGQTFPFVINALDSYAAGQIGWRDSDGDNIFDPLDTQLPISITSIAQDSDNITLNGTTEIIPYPSPNRQSVTINTLVGVKFRLNHGPWQQATATDGSFDETAEDYYFTIATPSPGTHNFEVAARDSAGNISDIYATQDIFILDPIDGGLNTELVSSNVVASSQTAIVDGVAYHMGSGIVASVQYRLDGGPWQFATPEDGTFDSSYEAFTLMVEALDIGTHYVEAFATSADGQTEINMASRDIKIAARQFFTIYVPIIKRGL